MRKWMEEKIQKLEAENKQLKGMIPYLEDSHCGIVCDENREQLEAENKKLKRIVRKLAIYRENTSYDLVTLLEDIKVISIKHGGYQNAYALSHIIDVVTQARTVLGEKMDKLYSTNTACQSESK